MKKFIKCILRFLKIGPLVRVCRKFIIALFDALGELIFLLLRYFKKYSKHGNITYSQVNKILIIRIDRIGDIILSTPAFRAMRETFINAEIHILVKAYTKDLVINNPFFDKILVYKEDTIGKDYDLVISLHPGYIQNRLTFACGARWRVGYTGRGGSFFLTHKIKDDRDIRIRHEVESALEAVGVAGCTTENKQLDISLTEGGERFAQHFFKTNSIALSDLVVVIHPGSRQAYIRWNREKFAEVSDRLIEQKNAKVLLIGSNLEKELVGEVELLMREKPICVVGTSLTELVSIIKRARLFIGNSTGPMHIAAACNVPVVAIFGSNHPLDSYKEWGPWGTKSRIIFRHDKRFTQHPSDYNVSECMQEITTDDVFSAAIELLEK